MTDSAAHVLANALKLSEEERGALAAALIESLDEDVEENPEASWSTELRQSLDELDKGNVATVPWAEARRLIMEDADGPPEP